jgi:hypothetical protein
MAIGDLIELLRLFGWAEMPQAFGLQYYSCSMSIAALGNDADR